MPVPCEPVWGCVYTGAAHTLCCQTTAGSFILVFAKWEVSFRSGIKAFPSGEPGICGKVVAAGALILALISDRSPNPISILPGSGLSELGALQHSPACGAEDRQGLVCEPELWWVLHEPPQLWGNHGEDAHVQTLFLFELFEFRMLSSLVLVLLWGPEVLLSLTRSQSTGFSFQPPSLGAGCVFLPRQRWQGELGVVWGSQSRIHPFIACLAIAWVALG